MILSKSKIYETNLFQRRLTDDNFRDNYIYSRKNKLWNTCLGDASINNYKKLIVYFISKGANNITWGLTRATEGGHKDLIYFFISGYRAYNWSLPLYCAIEKGYMELVDIFRKSMRDRIECVKRSIKGEHMDLLNFFISEPLEPARNIYLSVKNKREERFLKKVNIII